MAEIRRRKQEAGGDEDAACMGTSISPSITEAEKRNSSAADSSDHVSLFIQLVFYWKEFAAQ